MGSAIPVGRGCEDEVQRSTKSDVRKSWMPLKDRCLEFVNFNSIIAEVSWVMDENVPEVDEWSIDCQNSRAKILGQKAWVTGT